jgi:hypothetical protein
VASHIIAPAPHSHPINQHSLGRGKRIAQLFQGYWPAMVQVSSEHRACTPQSQVKQQVEALGAKGGVAGQSRVIM